MKIGVFGAGHLGKIHLKCIQESTKLQLCGFYDPKEELAQNVSEKFGIPHFQNPMKLMEEAELIDIVSPTITHYELAVKAMRLGKPVFIEKPVTHTLEEAEKLINLQKEMNVQVQIGHVERFNPAWLAVKDHLMQPVFIEGHRLATFNPRGTDVSVVLDLMIHDLDILLTLVQSPVSDIKASGVALVSSSPDICNARIEFANGCVANLTASRMSIKQMRKLRLFQSDAYISLDLLDKKTEVVKLHDNEGGPKDFRMRMNTPSGPLYLSMESPDIPDVNAIQLELETFADCIKTGSPPPVTLEDGYRALDLAMKIIDALEAHQQKVIANQGQSPI